MLALQKMAALLMLVMTLIEVKGQRQIDLEHGAPRFLFSAVTLTVSTTTPTTTSTPTCWTSTAALDGPCNGIRKRSPVTDLEDGDVDDVDPTQQSLAVDRKAEEERKARMVYGFFVPQSTLPDSRNNNNDAAASSASPNWQTMQRWGISLVTSTAPTVTVIASTKSTTTITCSFASRITAC